MTDAPELLPCPFCGKQPKNNDGGNSVFGRFWWRVWCDACQIELYDQEIWSKENPGHLDPAYPPKECFARWNTRADLATLAATEALSVLSVLSSYYGAGLGDEKTTAEQFGERIRWGVSFLLAAQVQRCADIVEAASKPAYGGESVSWGDVKAAILAIKDEPTTADPLRAALAVPEVARLVEALQPFAAEAAAWENRLNDERLVESFPGYSGTLTVGDLRTALAALRGIGEAK